jgi:hypothetical protein
VEAPVVAGAVGADTGTGRRSCGNAAGIDDLAGGEIDVACLVVLLDPGLIELVAEAIVDGEGGGEFEVVGGKDTAAPLALADVDTRYRGG